ncbi:hypothetical protein HNR42_001170 [Deinobacterium chartae]|uniref:Uncharacterized protein n=1 Tax=Deinobacterium chartae TaxID=521158 RepID=A0A841HXZ9_9DEIO|nr:hypothetical protein [Deinobacterium chartae]MBB6097753.1 hypothetical protein [Deinobacterium chartae]
MDDHLSNVSGEGSYDLEAEVANSLNLLSLSIGMLLADNVMLRARVALLEGRPQDEALEFAVASYRDHYPLLFPAESEAERDATLERMQAELRRKLSLD